MDKVLNYLALSRKAGLAELGEEPVGAITRTGKGYLVLVAADASDHTWRRAKSFVAGTQQQCVRIAASKEEMGFAVGRTSLAIAAITDPSMALACVKAMGSPEKHADVIAVLEEKSAKQKQRSREAKAHQRNVRFGRKSRV